jgi:hypothetical protein
MLPSGIAAGGILGLLTPGRRAAIVRVIVPESLRGAWLRYVVQHVPDAAPDPEEPEPTPPSPVAGDPRPIQKP